ncbi:hypothetical protein [Sphingobium sp. D43FB]|uniref:hypothetical protein n=1 Tax=Sphingobium sp. D43FB TaxID=2017595 RepID=UPI001142856A|nr:hypothetical protein [Sphingobium sp. D43FB]
MSKRIFVHIGYHKTGSTSIQVALSGARDRLEENGFLYPEVGCPEWSKYGHHLLAWSVFSKVEHLPTLHGNQASFTKSSRRSLWSDLRAEIDRSKAHNVIISSEEFDVCDVAAISKISSELKKYEIVPVFFIRNFADLIESNYNTTVVHSSGARPFKEFITNQRTRLDLNRMIQDWASISYDGTVHICNYDDRAVAKNSVDAFLKVIGAPDGVLSRNTGTRYNESLPVFVTELIQHLNAKGCGHPEVHRFIDHLRGLNFREGAGKRYTLYEKHDLDRLNVEYKKEFDGLIDNEFVSGPVGEAWRPTERPEHAYVGNHVYALLALAREIAPAKDVAPLPRS